MYTYQDIEGSDKKNWFKDGEFVGTASQDELEKQLTVVTNQIEFLNSQLTKAQSKLDDVEGKLSAFKQGQLKKRL